MSPLFTFATLDQLLARVRSREISPEQLGEFAQWLDTAPGGPDGKMVQTIGAAPWRIG